MQEMFSTCENIIMMSCYLVAIFVILTGVQNGADSKYLLKYNNDIFVLSMIHPSICAGSTKFASFGYNDCVIIEERYVFHCLQVLFQRISQPLVLEEIQ